jgi:hypothetical protein
MNILAKQIENLTEQQQSMLGFHVVRMNSMIQVRCLKIESHTNTGFLTLASQLHAGSQSTQIPGCFLAGARFRLNEQNINAIPHHSSESSTQPAIEKSALDLAVVILSHVKT